MEKDQENPKKNKEFDVDKIKDQLRKIAKPNCKRCHGEGYYGVHIVDGRLLVCQCAIKKIQPYWNAKIKERIEANAGKSRKKENIPQAG